MRYNLKQQSITWGNDVYPQNDRSIGVVSIVLAIGIASGLFLYFRKTRQQKEKQPILYDLSFRSILYTTGNGCF